MTAVVEVLGKEFPATAPAMINTRAEIRIVSFISGVSPGEHDLRGLCFLATKKYPVMND